MSRLRNLLLSLLIGTFVISAMWTQPAQAEERLILVAHDWQTYLRLAPLSTRDGYVPLLYNPEPNVTPAIAHFADLYGGAVLALDAEGVAAFIAAQWPRAETVVVADGSHPHFGLVAAAIAAALKCPLFFEIPAVADLKHLGTQQVIAVGAVALPEGMGGVVLREVVDAQAYYNRLVGPRPVAVLAGEGEMAFLAAEAVAFHRANLLLTAGEIPDFQPRYLAWVTAPSSVTKATVYELYNLCRFSAGSKVYDVGVGILTGLEPHDVALLMARAYAYPQLAGEWKTRVLSAGEKSVPFAQPVVEQLFTLVTLAGNDLTGDAFLEVMGSVGHVAVEAHGSPSGLALADGSWPGSRVIFNLPPLVFVAESCETGDLGAFGVDKSVALQVIAGGAVAYIGSLEVGGVGLVGSYPYAFSTPATPLGTLVRLQTAARMAVDADTPRVILIGDPTFHQFDQEWLQYELLSDIGGAARVQIRIPQTLGPVVMALDLPADRQIQYMRAYRSAGEDMRYMQGMPYSDLPLGRLLAFERPFSSAPTLGGATILLEWSGGDGILTLHESRPLGALIRWLLSNGLIGVQAIFIDFLSMQGTAAPLAIVSMVVLLVVRSKRCPGPAVMWSGVVVGVGMALVGIFYCLGLNFVIPWFVIVLLACGATTVVWLFSPRWRVWRRITLCALVYVLPFVVICLLAASVGASYRILLCMLGGIVLTAVTYGFWVAAAVWITARLRHTDGTVAASVSVP